MTPDTPDPRRPDPAEPLKIEEWDDPAPTPEAPVAKVIPPESAPEVPVARVRPRAIAPAGGLPEARPITWPESNRPATSATRDPGPPKQIGPIPGLRTQSNADLIGGEGDRPRSQVFLACSVLLSVIVAMILAVTVLGYAVFAGFNKLRPNTTRATAPANPQAKPPVVKGGDPFKALGRNQKGDDGQ